MKTRKRRKWSHALALAVVAILVDIGAQLTSGHIVNLDRAVIVGLLIGACGRALGAFIAARATLPEDTE